jgi:hypothetical protein
MPRNMLKGLVEELGHEYKDLFRAASFSRFDSTEKDWLLALQAKLILSSPSHDGGSSSEDSEDNEDVDSLMDISPDY